jgi:lipopolysaccharide transport system permease protein
MNHQENNTTEWLFEITPKISFRWISRKSGNRDLLMLFVKRCGDGIQTNCLGTAVVFDNPCLPPLLLLLFLIIWLGLIQELYLRSCLTWPGLRFGIILLPYRNVNTFGSNAGIFGKVYFPRIIVPISIVVSNLLKFSFLFFIVFLHLLLLSRCDKLESRFTPL